jgi:cyclopropane fatty-acyl-phospholipid synthase-like methyltransferase
MDEITKPVLFPDGYIQEYPHSSRYPAEWVYKNQMGPNALWLMEWLCQSMTIAKGSRVLDLGCGKAMSSLLVAEAYESVVWASDLWIDPSDNWLRIQKRNLQNHVFPIKAEAHALPFAHEYFDSIVSVDAYHYFGTDDQSLKQILKHLRPKGQIGIVVPGLVSELPKDVPDYLQRFGEAIHTFRTLTWWKHHWEKTGLVRINNAIKHPNGWQEWVDFLQIAIDNHLAEDRDLADHEMLMADQGNYLGFIQLTATKL